jgi:hypothetical protein
MSISRRNFILGTGAGLILPAYYDKVFTFFENHGEPLIEIPKQFHTDLFAVDWGGGIYEFQLGKVEPEPYGPMTLREYARRFFGDEQGYLDAFCCERDGIKPDFEALADPWMVETTWERDSPAADAYRLLDGLDLGPDFDALDIDLEDDDERVVGELDFVDCPNPCSSYLGVQTEDAVSVSLLQKRLNDLNTGIRVSMVEVS